MQHCQPDCTQSLHQVHCEYILKHMFDDFKENHHKINVT